MDHRKKMISTVLIGAVVVIYFVVYASFALFLPDVPAAIKIFFGVVGIGMAGGMIKVIMDRIEEIRKGEDDDLSNY